jgi:hypothetical protein
MRQRVIGSQNDIELLLGDGAQIPHVRDMELHLDSQSSCLPLGPHDGGAAEIGGDDRMAPLCEPEALRSNPAGAIQDPGSCTVGVPLQEGAKYARLPLDAPPPILEDEVVVFGQIVVKGFHGAVRIAPLSRMIKDIIMRKN